MSALAEAASDIRAREWQRSHYQLRTALNDVLSLGNTTQVAREIVSLRDTFIRKSEESTQLVEKGAEELVDTARRHEFAHIFKISVDLIRHKAQAQACRVIADELNAVLEAANPAAAARTDVSARAGARLIEAAKVNAAGGVLSTLDQIHAESGGLAGLSVAVSHDSAGRTNVVPLKRRFAAFGNRK